MLKKIDPVLNADLLHVADIEPLGSHTLAIGKVGPSAFTAQIHASSRVRPDDTIDVSIDPAKMHFLLGKHRRGNRPLIPSLIHYYLSIT